MENLPGLGYGATCCACVSFSWKILRDSPMVNFVSQTMNKHVKMRLGHRRRSMLPGNAKCFMMSLADTKQIFRERKIDISLLATTTRGKQTARASRATRL